MQRGDSLDFYPDEINALKGLKLAFKVSVTNFNVSKKNNQYGIARISEDASIIEQLKKKLNDSQVIKLLIFYCFLYIVLLFSTLFY